MQNIRSRIQTVSIPILGILLYFFTSCAVVGNEGIDGQFEIISFPNQEAPQAIQNPPAPTPFEIQTIGRRPSISNHDQLPSITFSQGKSKFEQWEQQEWKRKQEEKRQQYALEEACKKKAKIFAEQQLALKTYEQSRRDAALQNLTTLTPKIPYLIEQTAAFNECLKQDDTTNFVPNRIDYLKKYTAAPNHWEHKKYNLSSESINLLQNNQTDAREYEQLYGNRVQHGIHNEHVAIISHAAKLNTQTNNSCDTLQVCSFVVLAINTSHDTNIKGDFIRSLEINDVCFHILNPTHYAYLAGQLAKIQSHIEIDESTHWQKALDYLHKASQHDEGLSACLNATEKYTSQFKKANSDYTFHVLKVMSEINLHTFADLPLKKQYELLEMHHEAIAINALRSLHKDTTPDDQLIDYAIAILDLNDAQLLHNQNLIKTVLDPVDSLERTRKITNTPYHSTTQMPFVTDQGILKEHALIVDAHNLSLAPKHALQQLNLIKPTCDLLHIYCTADNSEDGEWASNGLFHASQAMQCRNTTVTKVHTSIAQQYQDALLHNQDAELLIWGGDLAREYADANQQQVHEELVWLTHGYLATENKQVNNEDELSQRLFNEIEEKLILAHHYNQHNQPQESHALIENIAGTFGTIDKAGQRAPYIFQPLNLNKSIKHISNSIENAIKHIQHVNKANCDINEKIKYATHELSNLSIQSGRVKRDLSQLTHEEAKDCVERKALLYGRGSKQKTIKNKLHAQGANNFDKCYPHAEQTLSPKAYAGAKQQYADMYYFSCIQNAREQEGNSLDQITTHIDSDIPSLKASEIIGFTIKPSDNTIEILPAPEHILQSCKEFWPPEELVEDIVDLWNEEIPLYPIGSQEAAYKRYSDRYDAYQETKDNPYIFIERTYAISPNAQQLLHRNEISASHLKTGTYNPLQHQLHTELLDILEQTTALDTQASVGEILRPINNTVLDFVSTAAYTNKAGDVIRTLTIADFCWATLDCGQAFLEGIPQGLYDLATYAYDHPIETILCTVAGKYMFYYQMTKLALELGCIATDYLLNDPAKEEKPTSSLRFRDLVKGVSSFGTQMYINHRVNPILTNYVDSAKSKLIDRLIHEEHWLLPQSLKNKLFDTAAEKAQVVLANGEKIDITLRQEDLTGSRNKGPRKPSFGDSNDKKNYPRPSPEETAQNRANKKLKNKSRKQNAKEKAPEKDARNKQRAVNREYNLQDAQQCSLHKATEAIKAFKKELSPFEEFLYQKYGIRIKGIDYYHHMERDFNIKTNEYTGFHSERHHPEHIYKTLVGPNEHGFKEVIVGNARKIKSTPSSIYPKDWDENTIGKKVIEGLLTGKIEKVRSDGTLVILGTAQNHIPGKGIVSFGLTILLPPNGIIRSSWPII